VPAVRQAPLSDAFHRQTDGYRRPLVLLSYAAQSRLGIDAPSALHGANVALHAVNGVLLFCLCVALGVAPAVAAAGAAVFAVHPLCSAAVAYVSGRTDVLAAFFTLLAAWAVHLTRARNTPSGNRESGTSAFGESDGGVARSATREVLGSLAVACFVACAALSKESGLLAGPIAAGLWWMETGHGGGPVTARAAGRPTRVLVPLAALITSGVLFIAVAPPALESGAGLSLGVRLRAAGAALATYARLLVAPTGLHLDRLAPVGGASDAWLGAAGALAIVIALAIFLRRPSRATLGPAALALLAIPASNLLPIYPAIADRWVFAGEQLAYLPIAVLAVLAASVLARLSAVLVGSARARDAIVLAAAAAVVALSVAPVSARQAELADAETVYRNTLAHSPSPRACFNLGVALLGKGKFADAAELYERCVAVSPHDAKMFVQLGVAYQRSGERNKAEIAYARAIELDPDDPYAWSNYASLEAAAGFYPEARTKWEKALALAPGFAPALDGLAKLEAISERARGPRPPS